MNRCSYPSCPMLDKLDKRGWNILSLHHAEAILTRDLDGTLEDLETVCLGVTLPIEEIVKAEAERAN